MKPLAFLLLTCLSLTSCSLPRTYLRFAPVNDGTKDAEIRRLNINSFGKSRFTGIAVLLPQGDQLSFTILDATGLRLLEAQVDRHGNYRLLHGLKKIIDTGLPPLLARSFTDIYLTTPVEKPCSGGLWHSICEEENQDGDLVKSVRHGPFTSWSVHFSHDNRARILYTRPWVGFSLTLSEIQ